MAFAVPTKEMEWFEALESVEEDLYLVTWKFNNTDNYWYISIVNQETEEIELSNFKVVVGRNIILKSNKYFLAIRSKSLKLSYTRDTFDCVIFPARYFNKAVKYNFVINL